MQDRLFWADQLGKLYQKNPALKFATPLLTSLSAQEIRAFVVGWIKLRRRWNNSYTHNLGFAVKGSVGIPGVCNLMLLPGGKTLLAIDSRGGMTLRRIKLEDGQAAFPVVTSIKFEQRTFFGPGRNTLLTMMSPCPVLVHSQGTK